MPTLNCIGTRLLAAACCAFLVGCGDEPDDSNNPAPVCDVEGPATAAPQVCSTDACAANPWCEALAADQTPPTIALDSPSTSARPEYTLEGTVTDEHRIARATVSVAGQPVQPLTLDGAFGQRVFRRNLVLQPGDTTVVVTAVDIAGNTAEAPFDITFEPPIDDTLEARFTASDDAVSGRPVTFDAGSTIAPVDARLEYRWDFGDGTASRGLRTSHAYPAAGEYVVELAVADIERGRSARFIDVVSVTASDDRATQTITAVVDVEAAGQPVEAARILIDGRTAATTDASGRAQLDLQATGFVDLEATAIGFVPQRRRLAVDDDTRRVRVSFSLVSEPDPVAPDAADDGYTWAQGSASLRATAGGLVDEVGEPVGNSTRVTIATVDPCSAPAQLPEAPAFGLDGEPVVLDARSGVHVGLDGRLVSDDPTESATLTVSLCETADVDPMAVPIWHLEPSGVWVQRGVAALDANTGSVTFPISAGGWWAVGPSFPQLRELQLTCMAREVSAECSVTLTSQDGRYSMTRLVPATGATIAVPSSQVRVEATTPDGACEASDVVDAASASVDLELACYGDGYAPIDYQTPPFDIVLDSTNPQTGFRFEGTRADGAWFDLQFARFRGVGGEVRLLDAEQRVLASYPIGSERAGVGFALPFDGEYFIELELTGGFGETLRADLHNVPVIDFQTTFPGDWDSDDPRVDHLVFVDPQRPVMNVFQYGEVANSVLEFVEFSGDVYRGRPTATTGIRKRPTGETGVTELPRGGFWRVEMRTGRNISAHYGEYQLEAVPIAPATSLPFDSFGRASVTDGIDRLGDHILYTFDGLAGDGVEVALRGVGASATEQLFHGAVRLWRVGAGSVDAPEQMLREYTRIPSWYAYSLDTFAATLPASDTYVLEVYHRDYSNYSTELGAFELRVDKVEAASTIIVDDDAACPNAATRSVLAAVAAAPTDARVELCEGTWDLEIELPIRSDGVTLIGRGRDKTRLSRIRTRGDVNSFQSTIAIQADRVRLAELTVDARSQYPNPSSQATLVEVDGDQAVVEDLDIRSIGANRDRAMATAGNTRQSVTVRRTNIENVYAGASFGARELIFEDNTLSVGVEGLRTFAAEDVTVRGNTQNGGRFCHVVATSTTPSRVLVASNTCSPVASSSIGIQLTVDGRYTSATGPYEIKDNLVTATNTFSTGINVTALGTGTQVSIDANRIEVSSNAVILRTNAVSSPMGHVRMTNNLVVDHGSSSGVFVSRADLLQSLEVLHNTFVSRPSTAAVAVGLDVRFTPAGALPLVFRNNIVRGEDGNDGAVGLSGAGAGPYSIEAGNNLLDGIAQPYTSLQNTSSDTDTSGNAQLDATTYAPAATSPAVDAVACNLGVPESFDGVSRPRGGICDIGAHEQ